MTDRLDDLLDGLPIVDPGPAFTDAVMAALPATRRPALHHGRWLAGILAAVLGVLWLNPGSEPTPSLAAVQVALAAWAGAVSAIQADLWRQATSMPWSVLTRILYAIAAGLVLAWSVPELALAVARRRLPHR